MLGSCLVAVDLLNVKLCSYLPVAVPVKFLRHQSACLLGHTAALFS